MLHTIVHLIKRWSINFICNANIPQHYRAKVLKWAGLVIKDPKSTFIGYATKFDTYNPSGITIEKNVIITTGVTVLSHYFDTSVAGIEFKLGQVHICENVFIGANAIICNAVTIGEGAIIGAGSVITKDVPPYEIWGGNPARFIKKCII